MRTPPALWVALVCPLAATVLLAGPADAALASPDGPAIVLSAPLLAVLHADDILTVGGQIADVPPKAQAAFEAKRPSSTKWRVAARSGLATDGDFKLRWRVPQWAVGATWVRIVALADGRTLVATRPQDVLVGPAPVYCPPPSPPGPVPAGDGWIVGGLYFEGGPAPGIKACYASQYALTVSDAAGTVVATRNVGANASYTVVLPAGAYTLRGACGYGTATVIAGVQTTANTYCLTP